MYRIHFLNVGHGDCVIVHFPERLRTKDNYTKDERIMMIDIHHDADPSEYENVINYYKENFKDKDGQLKPIFRFVCTHPHKDHISGIKELFENNSISISNFWDTKNKYKPKKFEDDAQEADWIKYEELKQSASNPTVIYTDREDNLRKYWDDDEDRISIIIPSRSIIEDEHSVKQDGSVRKPYEIEIDEISYSFLFRFNQIKLYLAGDGKEKCLNDIYANCRQDLHNLNILRAGHHGHEFGFHEQLVKSMNPDYIIFSNSSDEDGDYGGTNLYTKAVPNAIILKTSTHDTMVLSIDFENNYFFEDKFEERI